MKVLAGALARVRPSYAPRMEMRPVESLGVRGAHLHGASLSSVLLCIVLWIRAKTIGEDERGNAERRALFVGLWPPMFWLIGDTLERHLSQRRRLPAALRARR